MRLLSACALCGAALYEAVCFSPSVAAAAVVRAPLVLQEECGAAGAGTWTALLGYLADLQPAGANCVPPAGAFLLEDTLGLRLLAPLAGCGNPSVWQVDLPACFAAEANVERADVAWQQGSPDRRGALVAALAVQAPSEIEPLAQPSSTLVAVEWTLIGTIAAFGAFRLLAGAKH